MKFSVPLFALLFPSLLLAQEERPFAAPIFNQITVSAIPSYQKELHGKIGYSFSAIRICNPSGDSHLYLGMEYNHYSSYSGSGSTSPHSGYTNEISDVSSFMIPIGLRIDSDSSKKFFFNLGVVVLFTLVFGGFLYYRYKTKQTPYEIQQKMKRDQEIIMSKIQMYQDDKKRGSYSEMTKMPFVDTDYYVRKHKET